MSHTISGARFIAETVKGYGVTHVFFVEAILRRTLMEMETLGIRRVLTHSEKAAARDKRVDRAQTRHAGDPDRHRSRRAGKELSEYRKPLR